MIFPEAASISQCQGGTEGMSRIQLVSVGTKLEEGMAFKETFYTFRCKADEVKLMKFVTGLTKTDDVKKCWRERSIPPGCNQHSQ